MANLDTPSGEKPAHDAAAGAAEKPARMRAFAGNSFDDYFDRGMDEFPLPARLFLGLAVRVLWVFTQLVWPWEFERADLLTKDGRGRVIIMNHEAMLEPVVTIVVLWLAGVHVRPVYKSEFDRVPGATWLFSRVGGFPVDRGTADMKAVRRAHAALQRGECVLIYPEGTRVKRDADAEVHGGYALMAQLAKAPVQPCAVVGARNLRFRKKSWLVAGAPIEWSELTGAKRKEQVAQMEARGMQEVYALRDDLRRRHPEAEPQPW